ncbi:MAG: aminopeptidase, partial [Gemmatimonas sp.]
MHVTVIGDRECGLLVELGARDQIIDAVRAVEERIFGVAMQMHERHEEPKIAERNRPRQRASTARWGRLLRRVAGALVLVIAAVLTLTPMGCYISRAAYEEARILSRRQPIERLVAGTGTGIPVDSVTRAKLALVLSARRFAVDSLGLKAGESFLTYSKLDRDTLVLVL